MARKINKRLITILALIAAGIAAMGVWGFVRHFKDPIPFLAQGKQAMEKATKLNEQLRQKAQAQANQDVEVAYEMQQQLNKSEKLDGKTLEELWLLAETNLKEAYHYAQPGRLGRKGNPKLAEETMSEMIRMYQLQGKHFSAIRGWELLLSRNAKLYDAKYNKLKYMHEGQFWNQVKTEATELIDIINARKTQSDPAARITDPFAYLCLAESQIILIKAKIDQPSDNNFAAIEANLKTAQELGPKNPETFRLIALAKMTQAENSQDDKKNKELRQQAQELFAQAISLNPDDPRPLYYQFEIYDAFLREEAQQKIETATDEASQAKARKALEDLNKTQAEKLKQAAVKFPKNGKFSFYQSYLATDTDTAVAFLEQAVAQPDAQPEWYAALAGMYERKALASKNIQDWSRVDYCLKHALYHPLVLEAEGPRQNQMQVLRKTQLLPGLVETCAAQARLDAAVRESCLNRGKNYLQQLKDSLGESDVVVTVATGLLREAQGAKDEAINILYQAHRSLEMLPANNAMVQYRWIPIVDVRLFDLLRTTEFRFMAITRYGHNIRELLSNAEFLDYAEAILDSSLINLEGFTDSFARRESKTLADPELKERYLVCQARLLIQQGKFAEAQEILKGLPRESVERKIFWAQAQETPEKRIAASREVLAQDPGNESMVQGLSRYLLSQGKDDPKNLESVRQLLQAALAAKPDNLSFQEFNLVLQEADPFNVSLERQQEIKIAAIQKLSKPARRDFELGRYHRALAEVAEGQGRPEDVRKHLEQAVPLLKTAAQAPDASRDVQSEYFAANVMLKNFDEAQRIINQVRGRDATEALLYEADLCYYQEKYNDSASRLEAYLKQHPLSVVAHISLARAYLMLERNDAAIEEARQALNQDRLNLTANRLAAILLNNQYTRKGLGTLTEPQIREIMTCVEMVLGQNSNDTAMKGFRVVYSQSLLVLLDSQLKAPGLTPQRKMQLQAQSDQLQNLIETTARALIDANPKDIRYWNSLATFYKQMADRATDLAQKRKFEGQAQLVYQEALKANPNSPELMLLSAGGAQGANAQAEKNLQELAAASTGPEKQQARLRLAQLYLENGKFDAGMEQLNLILKEDPKNQNALLLLSQQYARQQNFAKAVELIDRSRQINDSAELMSRQAECLMFLKKFDDASKLLDELGQKHPEYTLLPIMQANLLLSKGSYDQAISKVQPFIDQDKDLGLRRLALMLKSNALFFSQHYPEAVESFSQFRAMDPEGISGRLELARVYVAMQQFDRANSELANLLKKDPRNAEGRKLLINIYNYQQRWNDLEKLYEESIELYPQDLRLYVEIGNALLTQGQQAANNKQANQAREYLTKSLKWMQKGWDLSKQMKLNQERCLDGVLRVLLVTGEYSRIIQLVDQNLTEQPTAALLLVDKAKAQHNLKQDEAALASFEKALEMVKNTPQAEEELLTHVAAIADSRRLIAWSQAKLAQRPDWITMRMVLAQLYQAKGDYAAQIRTLESALAQASEAQALAINYQLSTAYIQNKQQDKAIATCRLLIEKNPNQPTVLNNLSFMLMERQESLDEALSLAEKAYSLRGEDTNLMDTYALALIKKKDFPRAEEIIKQAIQQLQIRGEAISAQFYYRLGVALAGQNRNAEARQQLQRAQDRIKTDGVPLGEETLPERIRQLLSELK